MSTFFRFCKLVIIIQTTLLNYLRLLTIKKSLHKCYIHFLAWVPKNTFCLYYGSFKLICRALDTVSNDTTASDLGELVSEKNGDKHIIYYHSLSYVSYKNVLLFSTTFGHMNILVIHMVVNIQLWKEFDFYLIFELFWALLIIKVHQEIINWMDIFGICFWVDRNHIIIILFIYIIMWIPI